MNSITVTRETKSTLAKLLATENITIEHRSVSTASFNPKSRVLTLPVWKDMSGDLYDLMCGHEVGHALETPAQGWHDAATQGHSGAYSSNYKHFLNVVEDARIEKKIKRRFPGLKQAFIRGYVALVNRNFFGTKGRDLDKFLIIDKLNMYAKCGSGLPINFKPEEQKFVKELDNLETWDDVLKLTAKLWAYCKAKQQEQKQQEKQEQKKENSPTPDPQEDENDEGESSVPDSGDPQESEESEGDAILPEEDESEAGEEESSGAGDESEEEAESEAEEKSKKNDKSSDASDEEKEEGLDKKEKDSEASGEDDGFTPDPTSETDEAQRQNECGLLDEKAKPYVYVTFPKVNLKNIITPAKRVNEQIEEYSKNELFDYDAITKELNDSFRKKNERYVSLLAKEFEMRKAATSYNKSKIANTGEINMNKLAQYRLDDNIFKKALRQYKGKSHGLVMLLDKSGSMRHNMPGSIEQILVLALFCRKVRIPFVAYGFGNSTKAREADFPGFDYRKDASFTLNPGDLYFDNVYLREMINSNMSEIEFKRAVTMLLLMKRSYESYRFSLRSELMSNTPLNEALVALVQITNNFRRMYHLDIVNTIIVHDGDADNTHNVMGDDGRENYLATDRVNVVIRDKVSKKEYRNLINHKRNPDEIIAGMVRDYYTDMTDSRIFGFFLISNSKRHIDRAFMDHYYDENDEKIFSPYDMFRSTEKEMKRVTVKAQFKKDKFVESKKPGFIKFFMIPGNEDLMIDADQDFEFDGKPTTGALVRAFTKYNTRKEVNRVLVTKFIDLMSKSPR